MKKMKIAVIGLKGLPAFGGAATVGENIIEQLKGKYDFTVYSVRSHTDKKTGYYNGYKQIVFPSIPIKRLCVTLYYLFSAIHCIFSKFDIIHLHHNVSGFIIPLLWLTNKTIYTSHSTRIRENFKKYSFIFTIVEKMAVRLSTITTSVSITSSIDYKKIRKSNVYYIPNGINKVDVKKIKNTKQNNYLLFSAGRILPSKGCHILLGALNKIKYSKKVFIVGNTDFYTNEYKNSLFHIGKNLDIEFTGMIKDKERLFSYIKNALFFIFPSSIEAMSIMLLEVASIGTPVICSDIPENTIIFTNEEVLFFETDNASDLADKIIWANKNIDIMTLKASKAKEKVENQYLWKNIADSYNKLYIKLLK